MFNLFSKVSNRQIELLVGEVLDQYGRDNDFRAAALRLRRFADENQLGAWKRARFAAEITAYLSQQGLEPGAALAFGDAFALIIESDRELQNLNWDAYAAGMEGAVRVRGGWSLESSFASGLRLMDEYALNPEARDGLLRDYRLGWLACGRRSVAEEAVRQLTRHRVAAEIDAE